MEKEDGREHGWGYQKYSIPCPKYEEKKEKAKKQGKSKKGRRLYQWNGWDAPVIYATIVNICSLCESCISKYTCIIIVFFLVCSMYFTTL